MCGFVGAISQEDMQEHMKKAIAFIAHRGSSALKPHFYTHNSYSCAFTRLDICDPHTRAMQPFHREGYNFTLCFNGEIYNYKNLRNTLEHLGYVFHTDSDTEVLYYAYDYYKQECFTHLRGMFAVAIYHQDTEQLLLARDSFGIKPLYIAHCGKNIYFASEIKAFKAFMPLQVKSENIIEFLSYGIQADYSTIFQHIQEVPAGEIFIFQQGISKSKKFFELIHTFQTNYSPSTVAHIAQELHESIQLHCYAHTPFACQLSGGLDSSLVTALAKQYTHKLHTFSVNLTIQALDESYYQNLLSTKIHAQQHNVLYDDFFNLDAWKRAIYYEDFPLHHPNILASNALNSLAHKQGFKLLLSGDGADELFCGYAWYLNRDIHSIQSALEPLSYVAPRTLTHILYLPQKPIAQELKEAYKTLGKGEIASFLGQRIYLQKWLRRQDRSGMQNSIEIRVPFVDVPLARLLNSLSTAYKTDNYTQNKALLKHIAYDYLPNELIYQKKIGFPIPIKEYFASKQSQILYDMLYSTNARKRGIYNYKQLSKIIAQHMDNICDHSRILWLLCNLELWLQIFD